MVEPRLYLVACSKLKAAEPRPAGDLYAGDLFRKCRAYIEAQGGRWLILSARHGLLHPATLIAPYDVCLGDLSAPRLTAWGAKVRGQLALHRDDAQPVIVFAGRPYRDALDLPPGDFEAPLAGLGIGEQRAWLAVRTPQRVAAS